MFRTLTPVFSIVIALVVFFFFTRPMFADIKIIQSEVSEYQGAVEKAVQFNQLLQSLISKRNAFSAREMERLEALVPDTIDQVSLLVDIEGIARSHGMLMGNISALDSQDVVLQQDEEEDGLIVDSLDDLVSSDVTFSLIGSYDQFRSFLEDLERSLVRIEVVKIFFTVGESNLQQYELTVRAYALPSSE